jgi:hypothetical protein
MKRMFAFVMSLLFLIPTVTVGTDEPLDQQTWVQLQNIPDWVRGAFADEGLDEHFEFSYHLNPCYLRGDLNGDGEADVAILIRSIPDGKVGIAVCHYNLKNVQILGAGTNLGNGGANFSWMDIWSIFRKGEVAQGVAERTPPTLVGDALMVEKSESAGGLIYWDGEHYAWYQRGD